MCLYVAIIVIVVSDKPGNIRRDIVLPPAQPTQLEPLPKLVVKILLVCTWKHPN